MQRCFVVYFSKIPVLHTKLNRGWVFVGRLSELEFPTQNGTICWTRFSCSPYAGTQLTSYYSTHLIHRYMQVLKSLYIRLTLYANHFNRRYLTVIAVTAAITWTHPVVPMPVFMDLISLRETLQVNIAASTHMQIMMCRCHRYHDLWNNARIFLII